MAYQSVNPNTGKLIRSFEHLTDAQLDAKLASAEACFRTWRDTKYAERAVILHKAAALMQANVDDFANKVRQRQLRPLASNSGDPC
jgi:succinate-semialdehyde dehydrogenase / glutarate-semialdehyde dehydrogenase